MPNKPQPPIRAFENPFGGFSEEQMAGDPTTDRFYLKGYSDKRHARELAMKAGEKPITLPHRFQYVSIEKDGGKPDKTKYVEWMALGYRPVKWDEAASLGLDIEGSTAEKGPDGNVRVGSQVLMVTDAAHAARHFHDQRVATERQYEDHVEIPLKTAAERYNKRHGHTGKTGTKFEIDEEIR